MLTSSHGSPGIGSGWSRPLVLPPVGLFLWHWSQVRTYSLTSPAMPGQVKVCSNLDKVLSTPKCASHRRVVGLPEYQLAQMWVCRHTDVVEASNLPVPKFPLLPVACGRADWAVRCWYLAVRRQDSLSCDEPLLSRSYRSLVVEVGGSWR